MIELALIAIVAGVLYYLYDKDRKDRVQEEVKDQRILEAFEKTLHTVFLSTEDTTRKFYDIVGGVVQEHFNQIEKQADKERKLLGDVQDKFFDTLKDFKPIPVEEKITKISEDKNDIEQEERIESPLEDVPQIPIKDGINVQLEGEEEIYPIQIT